MRLLGARASAHIYSRTRRHLLQHLYYITYTVSNVFGAIRLCVVICCRLQIALATMPAAWNCECADQNEKSNPSQLSSGSLRAHFTFIVGVTPHVGERPDSTCALNYLPSLANASNCSSHVWAACTMFVMARHSRATVVVLEFSLCSSWWRGGTQPT